MHLVMSRVFGYTMPILLLLCSATAGANSAELFPRPKELEPAIAFWTDIYTKIDTDSGVIHDTRDLNIRYEIVNFSSNSGRRSRNRQSEQKKRHYEKILKSLATGKRNNLSADAKRVLAMWPADVKNKTLAQAARQVRFQLGQADRFREGVIRSGEFKPFIDATFAKRGLPKELGALPHVESSFNPKAYSKVGASGMWQFTRSTGRRYMRVDHVVDERRDPFLSSQSAARLLEHNYSVTGTWPLALTGYNHGVSGMRRAARKLGTTDIEKIIRDYKSRTFGFASRNFYVAFLAAVEVDQNPEKYFGKLRLNKARNRVLVTTDDYISAAGLADALKIELSELKRYNPALLTTVWSGSKRIPKGYTLRLPADALQDEASVFLASLDSSYRFSEQLPDVTHTVRRGESVSVIAATYGVKTRDVVELNGLRSRNKIRAGQVLRLPTKGSAARVVLAKAPVDTPAVVQVAEVATASEEPVVIEQEARGTEPAPEESVVMIAAETVATVEAASSAPADTVIADTQAALAADPSDYTVADDGRIEIQALETLGHYSDWLELKTQQLRNINGYEFRRPVVVGQRLKLDFSKIDRATFEARRTGFHRELQETFFSNHRIRDTLSHTIRRGESLWVLAQRKYEVPVWLLRQYNPDLNLDRIHPGMQIQFPVLEVIGEPADTEKVAENKDALTRTKLAARR